MKRITIDGQAAAAAATRRDTRRRRDDCDGVIAKETKTKYACNETTAGGRASFRT